MPIFSSFVSRAPALFFTDHGHRRSCAARGLGHDKTGTLAYLPQSFTVESTLRTCSSGTVSAHTRSLQHDGVLPVLHDSHITVNSKTITKDVHMSSSQRDNTILSTALAERYLKMKM